jgi:hypothetical protein
MAILRRRGRRPARLTAACAAALLASGCFGSSTGPEPTLPSKSAGAAAAQAPSESATPDPEPPPEVGECRGVSIDQLRTIVNDEPSVPCGRAHTVVTFFVDTLPESATRDAIAPADERVETAADRTCRSEFPDYVGGNASDRRLSMLTPTYFLPPSEQWNFGARWVRCDVYAYATPTELANLPRSLEGALDRNRTGQDFARCSPVSPNAEGFRHVICQEPHQWRAVATTTVGGDNERYPGARTVQDRARQRCEEPVRDYLQTDAAFSYGFEVPQSDAWSDGDRIALCWARTNE